MATSANSAGVSRSKQALSSWLSSKKLIHHPPFPPSLGKTIREGMGQATGMPDSETLDCIITNALIVDWQGIYKVRPGSLAFLDL